MHTTPNGCCGITRRGFLVGAGTGLAVGTPLAWLAMQGEHGPLPGGHPHRPPRSVEIRKPAHGMPGPFPGRVVEVQHPGSVTPENEIQPYAVKEMMNEGMCQLTGADHAVEAWRRFFDPGDVVGIKVNPVGRKRGRNDVGSISSPAVLLEIVEGLKHAGVQPRDIIVFERYADEFRETGYEQVLRERSMDGVRWYASSAHYDDRQVDIDGHDARARQDRDPHVVGYDPDVYVHMGFASPQHDPKDDRSYRTHLSLIITRMVNKFITIPVLKDHRSAGVTLAIKNMSHGMNNNVARSHISGIYRGDVVSGPNQCNTFIPTAVAQAPTRQKATLHIMDGLIGVYEGGPGSWNSTWATWQRKSLFFATDPVAMDVIGWEIIDAKRREAGWQPVARMGLVQVTPGMTVSSGLAPLGAQELPNALALAAAARNFQAGRRTEAFDRRQPEHVLLAGTLGMGVYERSRIDYLRHTLKA